MKSYRSKSRLVENQREYLIQTENDIDHSLISSVVFIDGVQAEKVEFPHPEEYSQEQVISLVKRRHEEKKREIENLLKAYREVQQQHHPGMMFHLATAFHFKGFYPEARGLFLSVLKMNPNHHQALNSLCMTELALGDGKKAIEAGQAAIAICPQYADYRNNLGNAYLSAGSCKDAVAEFEEAVRINLYYGDAYYNLGLALIYNAIKQQDTSLFANVVSKSSDCFKKAVLINPDYNTASFAEAVKILRSSDLEAAYARFCRIRDESKKKHQHEQAAFHMMFVLHPDWISEQVVGERIQFLQDEINKNPGYVDMYPELSRCYLEKARMTWEKGMEQYRKAIEINPSLLTIGDCLEEAQTGYEGICKALEAIAGKG
ncbi:MAG: tetratricopeptide repeat protein [candidate division Zixibacteria bacterium]|nr:tetratricopeptide repeat protein [candidate division Zixibacteria bacterium]